MLGPADSIQGVPLGDLKVLEPAKAVEIAVAEGTIAVVKAAVPTETVKSPAAIQFVRNRMLYARPVLNSRGVVTFGLRHIRKFPAIRCLLILC